MNSQSGLNYYFEHVEFIFLFALIAIVANWYAIRKRFYLLPTVLHETPNRLKLFHVLICFIIYLICSLIIGPFLAVLWKKGYALFYQTFPPPITLFGWAQLMTILLNMSLLFWFGTKIDRLTMKKIWKDYSIGTCSPVYRDFFIGICTWLLSFPVVVVIGQLTDMLLFSLFEFESYEQVAVRYLKMTLASPPLLAVALFTILIAAPIIEEFLFRGMLQNWLKLYVGRKAAILIAAFCFSLFHLAPSQGLGNISLIISLFSFACFLGFVYERQASLFASIGLHMTFNTISTLRILFSPDS